MSKPTKNEVKLFISSAEILEELNGIANALSLRVAGLTEEEKSKKRTAQLIAVGALWYRFLKECDNTEASRYTDIAVDLGRRIDVIRLS